jgi:tRNA/tmRNA/rRNA uracil-C5-methylase (TrmA/RlmC/RlmD family)
MLPGQTLNLQIDKPAVGGRMIARHEGRVVLVAGAIPGERVVAQVERVAKGVLYAQTVRVEQPSPDRREPFTDPACGGCLFAYMAYAKQLEIKAQVVADAFARIGRAPLASPVHVGASPDEGYRMRGRLHWRNRRLGFFREGTHEVCDARATRQLLPATCDVLDRLAAGLASPGVSTGAEIDVSENADASERALHIEGEAMDSRALHRLAGLDGTTGVSASGGDMVSGSPFVHDVVTGAAGAIRLRRHVQAFFQGNRFLLEALAAHVTARIPEGASMVDLYAGAGLFAIAAAAWRGARVTAVEGDRLGAADLDANAAACGGEVSAVHQSVEAFVAGDHGRVDVVVVDPPRTGMSREAIQGVRRLAAARIVYVSCDVATLARDTRTLLDSGYSRADVEAFDLFPNTPHVECVVTFDRV